MNPNINRLIGLFPCFIGLVFMLIGSLFMVKTLLLTKKGIRTRAKCVGSDECGDGSRPIVEFVDQAGAMQRLSLSGAEIARDGTLDVIYDPDNPSNVSCASFGHFWMFPLIFLGLGGGSVIMGVLILAGLVEVK